MSKRETTFTIVFTVVLSAIWLIWIEDDAPPGTAVMFVVAAILLAGTAAAIRRHLAQRKRQRTAP